MNPIKLGRPSPALVIACISLFVALGGVGYAAATGSIDGREIKNGAVASKDIKNSSVVSGDVKNSTLTGSDIKSNSVTGTDVSESSLGKVPSAGQADNAATASSANTANTANTANSAGNADTVGGQRIIPFVYRRDSTVTETTLANINGLEIRAACGGSDNDLRLYNRSGQTAEVNYTNVYNTDNTTRGAKAQHANNAFTNVAADLDDDGDMGQASFVNTATGKPVRVLYTLNEDVDGFDCAMSGTVIG